MCGYVRKGAGHVYPVFILDPWFLAPDPTAPSPGSKLVGVNRIRFLLQSLENLDENLRKHGSRLLLLHGNPTTVLPALLEKVIPLADATYITKNEVHLNILGFPRIAHSFGELEILMSHAEVPWLTGFAVAHQ